MQVMNQCTLLPGAHRPASVISGEAGNDELNGDGLSTQRTSAHEDAGSVLLGGDREGDPVDGGLDHAVDVIQEGFVGGCPGGNRGGVSIRTPVAAFGNGIVTQLIDAGDDGGIVAIVAAAVGGEEKAKQEERGEVGKELHDKKLMERETDGAAVIRRPVRGRGGRATFSLPDRVVVTGYNFMKGVRLVTL
jgi:hypothetical protein